MTQFTAVTPHQFADKSWQPNTSYAFAANANVVPVAAVELANMVPALPLGFVKTNDSFELVAITSLRPGTNLFVGPNGEWLGRYIPAALRGYPFRVAKGEGQEEGILCVNVNSGLVVEAGRGEAFFEADGRPSRALSDMLNFLSRIEINRAVTQRAVAALQAADIIQPWALQVQEGGKLTVVEGLYRIDEARLNSIEGDVFLSLRTTGSLPIAYAQLLSMNQLPVLEMAADMQQRLHAKAAGLSAAQIRGGEGFRFSGGDTLKFS